MNKWVSVVVFGLVTLGAAVPAAAQESAEAALAAWAAAYATQDGERSAAVYAPEARLWGTVARTQIGGRDAIRDYFNNGRQNFRSRVVRIGEHTTRVFGDAAVASGRYEFENVRNDGTSVIFDARFSMTFVNQNGQWLIADHHSSMRPAPPAPPAP